MSHAQTRKAESIYDRVTSQIIEAIEAGASSKGYRMPWHIGDAEAFFPVNAVSKRPYHGVNVLSLWTAARRRGYASGLWGTYKQWQELGGQVRGGEKSSLVVYWKVSDRESRQDDEDGSEDGTRDEDSKRRGRRSLLAKGYSLFNLAQVDGYTPPDTPCLSKSERNAAAEKFYSKLGANIRHGGIEAFYDPAGDFIQMPRFEAFHDGFAYYSTLGHEATHWTGAKCRLDRDVANRFGSNAYAAEELIAELGAAFLCSALKMSSAPRGDHAAYIAGWLELLRSDKHAIFTASSKAQEAVDWMRARQGEGHESGVNASSMEA